MTKRKTILIDEKIIAVTKETSKNDTKKPKAISLSFMINEILRSNLR